MIIPIDGVNICIEEAGREGPRVLLLHGWGCDISLMRPVAERLQNAHRVMMVDFPGHGQSGRPPIPWGVPEYAECIAKLLRKTGFYPCSVIAHSFGCRVAAWLETEQPELFEKLVFTGAAGIRKPQTVEGAKRAKQYQQLKKINMALKRTGLLAPLADKLQKKAQQKYGSRDFNALDDEMKKTFVKVIGLDLSDRYEKFRHSTLLIWGDQDTETPLWMGREMESKIPDSGLVLLEGGTHFAYLEQVDRFALIAGHFLKEEQG